MSTFVWGDGRVVKFNQLLAADASEVQTSKMAARRMARTPERFLSIFALH